MQMIFTVILAFLMFAPALAEAQLSRLTVTVDGLTPATGTIEISVFNSPESFLKKPMMQQSRAVDDQSEITVTFSALLEGDYAIVVVHDENGNGVLDSGFLGLGGESVGYSNNAKPWLGRPTFKAAKISVSAANKDTDVAISLE